MNVRHGIFFVAAAAALVSVAGCGNKDDDELTPPVAPAPQPTAIAPTPAPTPTTPMDMKPEGAGTSSKIEARVRSEVDGREDGITGSPLAAAGARATLQAPTGWTSTKSGEFTVASAAGNKAQIAASAADSATAKLPAAVSALGLTNCEWNPGESLSIGKGKLAGSAADGVCTRGTVQVRTAYVAPAAEGLLVVGAWEPDGDSAGVFGSMRSITKSAGGTGDASGIGACCSALAQNANSAPPEQKGLYLGAAGLCNSMKANPQGRAALAQVRAMLASANVPSSCR